jgi:hypothetical protein
MSRRLLLGLTHSPAQRPPLTSHLEYHACTLQRRELRLKRVTVHSKVELRKVSGPHAAASAGLRAIIQRLLGQGGEGSRRRGRGGGGGDGVIKSRARRGGGRAACTYNTVVAIELRRARKGVRGGVIAPAPTIAHYRAVLVRVQVELGLGVRVFFRGAFIARVRLGVVGAHTYYGPRESKNMAISCSGVGSGHGWECVVRENP